MIKTAMGWLELPHWLIIAGAALMVAACLALCDQPPTTDKGLGRRHRMSPKQIRRDR